MDATTIARERVIAMALNVAAGRASRESRMPSAHDSDQADLELDMLDDALAEYVAHVTLPA